MSSTTTAAAATTMEDINDEQKSATTTTTTTTTTDDPRIQSIMDRCEDLGLDSTTVDSIEQWTTAGLHSIDWRRFIATHVAQLHTLSALVQPELDIGSAAKFQLQVNAILASLSYPPLSAGPYSLSSADECADVTDFLLSELQAARMLLSTQQPASGAVAAGSSQSELQAELVRLAAVLQQPMRSDVSATQFFSSLSTALTALSAPHPSLQSTPLLSASDYTPQQLTSLDSLTSALSTSLSARLSRLHSRHTATLHSLSPASTALDAVAPSEADSRLHVWQAFGVTADMVAAEERGAGVVDERVKGRDGSRHGESGLEGVMDRGGRMDGRGGGGGGGRGGGGGGGGRHGKGGKRGSGKELMDEADDFDPQPHKETAGDEEDDDDDDDKQQSAAAAAVSGSGGSGNKKNSRRGGGGKRHKQKKTVQEMQEQAHDDTMEK